jgi:anti-sigma regulatory factor (Ser/Thr protein kinase)
VPDHEWFHHEMAATTEQIVGARSGFEGWLRDVQVGADAREDLAVVLSELAANAVAAATRADDVIRVQAWRESSAVVVEVENAAASQSGGVVFHSEQDPLRGYGQGLLIVTAYTDSVEVVPPSGRGGLVVRCRKELGASA